MPVTTGSASAATPTGQMDAPAVGAQQCQAVYGRRRRMAQRVAATALGRGDRDGSQPNQLVGAAGTIEPVTGFGEDSWRQPDEAARTDRRPKCVVGDVDSDGIPSPDEAVAVPRKSVHTS
ncbi:hypothetical protein GCM10010528_00440 [Gordonia defluvii]|uniref:Uncharacterized protein n=1 Tax=Gordonia defluvii TaxID=283718 RepID=A0ABP6KRF9_9ACTN